MVHLFLFSIKASALIPIAREGTRGVTDLPRFSKSKFVAIWNGINANCLVDAVAKFFCDSFVEYDGIC